MDQMWADVVDPKFVVKNVVDCVASQSNITNRIQGSKNLSSNLNLEVSSGIWDDTIRGGNIHY